MNWEARMFKWRKCGLIFTPDQSLGWMHTHAQVPYTLELEEIIRVYFSTREEIDPNGQYTSHSGYVDFSKKNFPEVLKVADQPIIPLGGVGEFDEFGSMAGSIIKHAGKYYLYYCGWTRAVSVPYAWAIGLAVSEDGANFTKLGKGPLLGPTLHEPYLQACPIVYKISDDNWFMFYLSGTKWIRQDGKLESQYLLMRATSEDGITWKRDPIPVIPTIVEDECQTSASIIKLNNAYHMFFSYRHGTGFREDKTRGYRIGYASSPDLITWTRNDSMAGLDVSPQGWDSHMVAYPHVFNLSGRLAMLYCGNDFGKEGFGYAVLEEALEKPDYTPSSLS